VKAVLQDTYGSPEVTRMEGSRPMRATALLFARSRALVRPASRGTREDTASRPPHPLTPQMRAPAYLSGERLLRTSHSRLGERLRHACFVPSMRASGGRGSWCSDLVVAVAQKPRESGASISRGTTVTMRPPNRCSVGERLRNGYRSGLTVPPSRVRPAIAYLCDIHRPERASAKGRLRRPLVVPNGSGRV
jgi:hypothetical protein